MKTLLIAPEVFLAEGGIARILRAYLHALPQCDSAVDQTTGLIVMNDTPESLNRMPSYLQNQQHNPLVACSRSKLRFILACLRHGFSADRIICGHLHLSPITRFLKLIRPRLKYYIIAHGIEVWRPYSRLEKQAFLNATGILCVSAYSRRQIIHYLPQIDQDRLLIVPNTLDPDFELPEPPISRAINRDLRILSVGRLTAADVEKGFESMIRAMPMIRQRLPHATLRIVGGGNDLERLRKLALEIDPSGSIQLLGRIDDSALRDEYAHCDIFALPSRKEGFGLVYLEAMSFGKACLAARAGGAPEVVNDQVGALIEYDDHAGIAQVCEKLAQQLPSPKKVRAHLEYFSFAEFTERLASALGHS